MANATLPDYTRRTAPKQPLQLKGYLDVEFQNIMRGISGRAARALWPYAIVPGETGVVSQAFPVGDVRRYGALLDGSNDTTAVQNAIDSTAAIVTGLGIIVPVYTSGFAYCSNLTQSLNGQIFRGEGAGRSGFIKNANGVILTSTGNDVQLVALGFRGDASTPTFTGDNVTLAGDRCAMIDCGSQWAHGRAVKCTGNAFQIAGGYSGVYQTATGAGYDIELGVSGTLTAYHMISNYYSSQATGGILLTDTGSHIIQSSQFGKYTVAAGTSPAGVNGGIVHSSRILGNVTIGLSNAALVGIQFGAIAIAFNVGTSGCTLGDSNVYETGCTITNNGNENNLIIKNTSTGSVTKLRFGQDTSIAVMEVDPSAGSFLFPKIALPNNTGTATFTAASGSSATISMSSGDNFTITNGNASGAIQYTTSGTNPHQFFCGANVSALRVGTGTPEGAVTAPVGSLFVRTDGGAGTVLYVKETGSGNTGWVGK